MVVSAKIKKPIGFVVEYLTDMQKFTSVHPVITKIDKQENNRYLVHEQLKLGLIRFSFTYPVTIDTNCEQTTITMRATVMKLTKVEMTFLLTETKDYTMVTENIVFRSLLPVGSILENIFRKHHTQLFINIENT